MQKHGLRYTLARWLIQSAIVIIMVMLLSWLGIFLAYGDYILIAMYIVGALFVGRISAIGLVFVRGMTPGYFAALLQFLITVVVATILLVFLAQDIFFFEYWYFIAGVILLGDIFAWYILEGVANAPMVVLS